MVGLMKMEITPVERLHLEHVLQTVSVLESVVLRSFGPEGGQVLFTRDTGQAMLSRSGKSILTALRLEHPLARMVVDCVIKQSNVTGDGSKTFVLWLASLLRLIHTTARKEPNVSRMSNSRELAEAVAARHLADKLLAFALEELDDFIATGVAPYGFCLSWDDFTAEGPVQLPAHTTNHFVQKLLASFFQSRVGCTHCDFIAGLTCDLLTHWKCKGSQPSSSPQFVNDNFNALHTAVSGFPINSSRLIEGQIIHRDFSTPCPETAQPPIKAVVFTGHMQPELLCAGEVLELRCKDKQLDGVLRRERNIVQFNTWMEKSLESVITNLQSLGVSVVLSAVKQSAAALALAAQANICIVECVSEEELSLFAELSGARPVSDCRMIEPDHIAQLSSCRAIQLGAHRYIHVTFHVSEEEAPVKPCSLVICGPGEGQTEQHVCAFGDAIRMLTTTWESMDFTAAAASKTTLQSKRSTALHSHNQPRSAPVLAPGCIIPAGGTFEFLLNRALLQHGHSCSVSDDTNTGIPAVSQILATALLSVPRQIYSHSPRCFLQAQTRLLNCIQNHSHPFSLVYMQNHTTVVSHNQGKSERLLQECTQHVHSCTEAMLPSEYFLLNSGLESVACKYQLLVAVLQCVSTLLKVDAMLRTNTALHSQSRRLASISWETSEDEPED
ncbi:uncharacterized protein V6R79_014213 [Siganus canaliculatus]